MPYNIGYTNNKIPGWLDKSFQDIAKRAGDISVTTPEKFGGPRLAGTNPYIQAAQHLGRSADSYRPLLDSARNGYNRYSDSFPSSVDQYMNPYTDRVVNRISELGNRNFNEKIMPALEAKFVRQGTFGGSQHQKLASQAARDVQDEILGRQSAALSEGYRDSAQQFNLDRARQIEAAKNIANLGPMYQSGRFSDIAQQMALGEQQQGHDQDIMNLKYQDFLKTQHAPLDRLMQYSNMLRAVPVPVNSQQTSYESNPPKSQLNTAGQLGALATSLLGASMQGGGSNIFSSMLGRR